MTPQASSETDRDQWLDSRRQRLRTAGEWLRSGGSVLLYGPSGARKSTALAALAATAARSRVLRCTPAERGAGTRYAALADLLSRVTPEQFDQVPAAGRRLLAAVAAGAGDGVEPAEVRRALVALWRALARARPLLVVVDDLQWVDEASADVLEFAATGVDDVPVHLAAAERVPPGGRPRRRHLCPSPLLVVGLEARV
ncbi:ATP-binding protein [Planosporangium thailandense]|uniref:ATP-binding protein n=1 Tax=Planosporangium thailandense TaxID=765197 RepID=A0ABX0XYX1_9ACTN|nr:ATP-binding protein [Planosporangium thailandense]